MTNTTPRMALPLLQAGQAQKEAIHNEALTILDAIVGGAVESIGDNEPPPTPASGQMWIVGAAPAGAWAGHAGDVSVWTAGGWRFVPPAEGMGFRLRSTGVRIERGATAWGDGSVRVNRLIIGAEQVVGPRLSGISAPDGGAIIDTEARAATVAILVALRTHGLISA